MQIRKSQSSEYSRFVALGRSIIKIFTGNPATLTGFFLISVSLHANSGVVPLIDLLNPTGYVTHQQFNIQQLYALLTLYLCVLYLSENKQRLVPLTA